MSTNDSILIIDNRQDNIEFLTQRILDSNKYDVMVAHDGEQGLREALDKNFDLIILDLNVPRMTGLEVLRGLRKAQRDTPVILVTFHGSEEAAVQAFRLAAHDYIIKPYSAGVMRRSIEDALSEHRLQRERDQLAENLTRANRAVERRLKELNILSSIGKSVTALLDEDRLLTRLVEAAVYVTGAEEGMLLLVDETSGELYMRAARGLGEKYARGFRLKINDSLAGEVIRTGKPVIITGSRQEDRFKVKTGYLVKSLLHVPLKVGDSVIGVLSVDHMFEDRTFSNHDLYLLSILADYAAIALENSRLYARLQSQVEQLSAQRGALPPVQAPATLPPELGKEIRDLVASVNSHHAEIRSHLQSGSTVFADLRDQISGVESWLDQIAAEENALIELSDQLESLPGLDAVVVPPSRGDSGELDAILDSIVDGILVVGQDDRIVMSNQIAEEILGAELEGRHLDDVCDDPRWPKTYRIVKAAAQLEADTPGSAIRSVMTPLVVAPRMLRASFRVKSSSDQTPSGVVVVLRDITAEREAQRAKDSFVASISQELRTPMTSIVGYADLLLGESVGQLEETQGKFLRRIRANAGQIGNLLNDLVGMTTIDSKQLEIKAEALNLLDAIQEVLKNVESQLAEKSQVLETNLNPRLPYVQADPDAIHHMLTSLLQNAHHCSPENAHIVLRATRMSREEAAYVLISIADAGGGIAPENYRRVFNRFYRSDNPSVPGLGDPGVGLPIVKVLVEAHGGRIWIDTQTGVGSTFTILLPVHPATMETHRERPAS